MNIKEKFRSLKIVLSSIVVAIIILLSIILVLISYNAARRSVESAFVNQLTNINKDLDRQLTGFFDSEMRHAEFLAATPAVVTAAITKNFGMAAPTLNNFFDKYGTYENVFLSSAEQNPQVIVSGSRKGAGTRWGGIGYDENITKALEGKSWVSQAQKSPITGLPVVLVSAPIMDNNRIVGIVGLAVELSKFSQNLIKNVKIGNTGYAYIMRADGLTFAHPQEDLILKMDIKTFDWGRKLLSMPSGSVLKYEFQGLEKIQTFIVSDRFHFIVGSTMFMSDINSQARVMALQMILFTLLGVIAAGLLIYFVIASRLKPLEVCRDIMGQMARGDFTRRYEGRQTRDEIGDISHAVNNSLDQFEKLIAELVVSAQNLAQAVSEISSGNQNLSQRTTEQASSLEEIASTLEESSSTINQNAENSVEANEMSGRTSQLAESGGKIIDESVVAINEINSTSKKIGDIISVINEISFQTNLLALNAAVEAARAGDHGRGFAVVAGEVRNLAQRSGTAAKEIADLIKTSIGKVENGTRLVNESGQALRKIIDAVNQVGALISEISAASQEQKQGMDQITVAVSELDNMTQQNAALVEETASASEEMANQAQELLSMMERFKVRETVETASYSTKHREVHIKAARSAESSPAASRIARKSPVKPQKGGTARTLKDDGFVEF